MLNELLSVERGIQGPLDTLEFHPDIKCSRRVPPTLLVSLDATGAVASVRPLPTNVRPWALRDGQQNSFPLVQPKQPLLAIPPGDKNREKAVDRKAEGRRVSLLALTGTAEVNVAFADWPGAGMLERLRVRREQLSPLSSTDASALPATIDRFLLACDPRDGGNPLRLLRGLTEQLAAGLRHSAYDDWVDVAIALLLGRPNASTGAWECCGGMLFDAESSPIRIYDERVARRATEVLRAARAASGGARTGICRLTGQEMPLLSGSFPQPNLPVLGQTFLFAKNKDIPANDRYGRLGVDAMTVGEDTAIRLDAALRALTQESRHGVTWRKIPGEAPKQADLLLAFVDASCDAPVADALAGGDTQEDLSEEVPLEASPARESVAAFEKRTERVIEAIKGKVEGDFRQTPVHMAIFRRVDPANRKVVYAGTPTVAQLYDAATAWAAGERNLPLWLELPVSHKGESKPRLTGPPHVSPFGMIAFSRQAFACGGTKKIDIVGLAASEAMALFLASADVGRGAGDRPARRFLRLALNRRGVLISEIAHARTRGFESLRNLDRREALRTVTVLGLLLHKLGRSREVYMDDTAFKLGQLLAAADAVHLGYCADVRGGQLPPSLLGNQVFTMAQSTPAKALATLCRRWKPYDGWAKKAERDRGRANELVASKKPEERQRGWDIRRAIRHAREMQPLADQLSVLLAGCEVNDTFRAELLLGYIAGLPKMHDGDAREANPTADAGGEED